MDFWNSITNTVADTIDAIAVEGANEWIGLGQSSDMSSANAGTHKQGSNAINADGSNLEQQQQQQQRRAKKKADDKLKLYIMIGGGVLALIFVVILVRR